MICKSKKIMGLKHYQLWNKIVLWELNCGIAVQIILVREAKIKADQIPRLSN